MRAFNILAGLVLAACGAPSATRTPTAPRPPTDASAAQVDPPRAPLSPHASGTPELAEGTVESVGGLSLGTSADAVLAKLGEPDVREEEGEQDDGDEFVVRWEWRARGVVIDMLGTTPDGPLSVHSLWIRAPSKLETSRGVGIGTPRAEVERLYQGLGSDDEDMVDPNEFVMGDLAVETTFRFDEHEKVLWIAIGPWE